MQTNSKEKSEETFKRLGVDDFLVKQLQKRGINSLFEVQTAAFERFAARENLLVSALTGSGKTLAFILPLLQQHHRSNKFNKANPSILVMAPVRELAIQIDREFNSMKSAECSFKTVPVYGGTSIEGQVNKLEQGCSVVVGTPGRIKDMINRGHFKLDSIASVVLDEADRMLDMGFKEEVTNILGSVKEAAGEIQLCLFSATMPDWVNDLMTEIVGASNYGYINLVKDLAGKTPKNISHLKAFCEYNERPAAIARLIQCFAGKDKSSIVFMQTKVECTTLNISAEIDQEVRIMNGDVKQFQRERIMQDFRDGKFRCLVATDVAARGLDIPHVDLVVQTSPPREIDSYIHRAGRTARAGKSGVCITLYADREKRALGDIERQAEIKMKEVTPESLSQQSQNNFPSRQSSPKRQRPNSNGSKKQLFIGNLPNGSSEGEIEDFLQAEGAEKGDFSFRSVKDRETGEPKPFGFLDCFSDNSYNFILDLNGRRMKGRALRINDAASRTN